MMKYSMAIVLALLLSTPGLSFAQYKCVVNGKTVYADVPCAADAKHVGALEDYISRESRLDRARVVNRERNHLGAIESENDADRRRIAQSIEQIRANDRAAANLKAARCSNAQRDLQNAQRASAVYRDLNMQNSANQRRGEIDSAERRVRDECN
ncbi:MAG: DUF4124 domain-containing protein [Rhodocyclales bacterium GT-UBC]|nr:MAG: DUF4124 domain-containing protein [Rhodocyclales bacterium GT-UBC]